MAPEKIRECLIQGLKEKFAGIIALHDDCLAIKATVLALEPDLTDVLTPTQITALNTILSDQTTICDSSVYSVVEGKPNHPSHNWRQVLGL